MNPVVKISKSEPLSILPGLRTFGNVVSDDDSDERLDYRNKCLTALPLIPAFVLMPLVIVACRKLDGSEVVGDSNGDLALILALIMAFILSFRACCTFKFQFDGILYCADKTREFMGSGCSILAHNVKKGVVSCGLFQDCCSADVLEALERGDSPVSTNSSSTQSQRSVESTPSIVNEASAGFSNLTDVFRSDSDDDSEGSLEDRYLAKLPKYPPLTTAL